MARAGYYRPGARMKRRKEEQKNTNARRQPLTYFDAAKFARVLWVMWPIACLYHTSPAYTGCGPSSRTNIQVPNVSNGFYDSIPSRLSRCSSPCRGNLIIRLPTTGYFEKAIRPDVGRNFLRICFKKQRAHPHSPRWNIEIVFVLRATREQSRFDWVSSILMRRWWTRNNVGWIDWRQTHI